MKIDKQHIPVGKKRPGYKFMKTSITIHSTDNPRSTPQNERDYLTNPINQSYVGYHYVVGDSHIIECIPPSELAYHCGNKNGNKYSIGIEMVETGNRDKVIDNTIELTKYLQRIFNISNDNVVRHHDWVQTNKSGMVWYENCPKILNKNGDWKQWEEFKLKLLGVDIVDIKDVRTEINEHMFPSSKKSGLGMWAEKHFINLNARGIKINEKRYNDVITRGELFALLDRLTHPDTIQKLIEHSEKNKAIG